MSVVEVRNLDSMSQEELDQLQAKLKDAQLKKQLGRKYAAHKAVEQIIGYCVLPERYKNRLARLTTLEPEEIIPSIIEDDTIVRFPILMVLACFLPCSEIQIRCGLIELFDSYVYHSDFGLVVSNLVPFDVDRALMCCRTHDPLSTQMFMEDFHRRLVSIYDNPISEGESRVWIHKCMDDVTFITHVVAGSNIQNRFQAALQFMLPNNEFCDLDDDKAHRQFVDMLSENGSDLLYAKRIASTFKL